MDFSKNLFQIPVVEFIEEDLQELLEPFDPENAGRWERNLSAMSRKRAEPQPKSWAESLQLFSLY